jgi:hypothetical protein
MNDFLADERAAHWHGLAREDGTRSGASFPLLKNGGEAIGVLLFLSCDQGAFTADLVALLGKLAENVSFALDNFDRADEKAKTEQQKERLTRMFAALSATNEAIMRAKPSCSNWCATPRSWEARLLPQRLRSPNQARSFCVSLLQKDRTTTVLKGPVSPSPPSVPKAVG